MRRPIRSMFDPSHSGRLARRSGGAADRFEAMESLEHRTMLAATPLPDISALQNPSNTVVRFETNYGDIDIEMFDTAAPNTVTNFLSNIRDGDYDDTIIHRRALQDSDNDGQTDDPFVIQGGGYRLKGTNPTPSQDAFIHVPQKATINDEFNQSNLTRTIAMARSGPNTATSEWFINMANNTFLDSGSQGGFTVFGRILDDRSWNVVLAIQALSNRMITSGLPFNELPVGANYDGSDGLQLDELVTIVDAEIIKPANVAAFYQYKLYFPEGFAASSIAEFVPLLNAGASAAHYQVIIRSEVAKPQPDPTPGPAPDPEFLYRDKVIQTGTIGANFRSGLTVSRPGTNGVRLVQRNVPFAYEIWSTRPLSANLSHYASGSTTGESFTDTPATKWTLPEVSKGTDIQDFVLWQNPNDETVDITLHFFFANPAQNFTFDTTTAAFRRGGFNVETFGTIPAGSFSLQITSSLPIVVSRSHYNTGTDKSGSSELGIRGDGLARGVFTQAGFDTDSGDPVGQELIFFNPGSTAVVGQVVFTFDDNSPPITQPLIMSSMSRVSINLSGMGLDGRRFTASYTAGDKLIYATSSHSEKNDVFATPFQYTAATKTRFAEGFMVRSRAGNNLFETISVYNPYSAFLGQTETTADITLRFIYNDGSVVTHDFSLDGGKRADIDLHTLEVVLAQSDIGKKFFSIEVVSTVPVIAAMRHIDLISNANQPPGGFEVQGVQVNPVAFADLASAVP